MKELVKSGSPARFERFTQWAGSLVIAMTTTGVVRLLGDQQLGYLILLSVVFSMVLFWIFAMGFRLNRKRFEKNFAGNDQVFFMLCAFKEKRWVAGLIQDMHNELGKRGFDLVLKIPERNYSHLEQVRLLRGLGKQGGRYIGGIVSPAWSELLRCDLRKFRDSVDYPIIFVDADLFGTAEDYPPGTAFVGYSAEAIGHCAADYVAKHARGLGISSPGVLVIGSDKLHLGRQEEFINSLRCQLEGAIIIREEGGDFDRGCARRIVCERLRTGGIPDFGYIFCTNDEMALGAVDALISKDLGNDGSMVVVGVDGIPEARALIDARKTPLRATVVQDSCLMAEKATDLLDKAISGESLTIYNYLEPQIYSKDR